MKIQLLSIAFVSLLAFFACDSKNYLLDEIQTLPETGWTHQDTLVFKADIQDTAALYNLILTLEHRTTYAKQNIYTVIHTTFPDGQRFTKEVSLDLANKTGKWYGDCSSSECLLHVPIQQQAFFNQAGVYTFVIEQFTRFNPLPDVQKVGFKIENTGQKRK